MPDGKLILSPPQLESNGCTIVDKARGLNGGEQPHVQSPDGHRIPLSMAHGLMHVKIRPALDSEWDSLMHVHLTADDEWDPRMITGWTRTGVLNYKIQWKSITKTHRVIDLDMPKQNNSKEMLRESPPQEQKSKPI